MKPIPDENAEKRLRKKIMIKTIHGIFTKLGVVSVILYVMFLLLIALFIYNAITSFTGRLY